VRKPIRLKKAIPSVDRWFFECFVGSELQAEAAKNLGVPNDLQSVAKAYIAKHRASLRKAKVIKKGFGVRHESI
jgi:hypothetical protein